MGSGRTRFGGTYTKIGTIQRRLAWPLRKDDTQNREAFHILPHQTLKLPTRTASITVHVHPHSPTTRCVPSRPVPSRTVRSGLASALPKTIITITLKPPHHLRLNIPHPSTQPHTHPLTPTLNHWSSYQSTSSHSHIPHLVTHSTVLTPKTIPHTNRLCSPRLSNNHLHEPTNEAVDTRFTRVIAAPPSLTPQSRFLGAHTTQQLHLSAQQSPNSPSPPTRFH